MFLDLLRLASLKQNMELYGELHLQAERGQRTTSYLSNPSIADLSSSRSRSRTQQHQHQHHSKHRLPLSQEASQQAQPAQCKPLDLSAKSSKQQAATNSNKSHQRRPKPIDLSSLESSPEILPENGVSCCSQVQGKASKLITSSTSPSSGTHSVSSVSSVESKSNEVISSTNSSSSFNIKINTRNSNSTANFNNSNSTTNSLKNSLSRRQKHKGAKSHLCTQCGRSFSRSDMLTRHSRLHSGLKPYQCSKCKQVFSRSDHLSTHERTHTGEKPYQCQFCAYSACRRDMITRHMRTHSNGSSRRIRSQKSTKSPKIKPPEEAQGLISRLARAPDLDISSSFEDDTDEPMTEEQEGDNCIMRDTA